MTSLSSIPLPRAKSCPFHTFPLPQKKTWRTPNNTRSFSRCTTRLLSVKLCLHMVLEHTTTCPVPRSTAHRTRTQSKHFSPSSTSCIIHELTKILSRGSTGPNTPQIYTSLNPLRFSATSMLQHPSGHCQSHAAQVPGKQTALDFAPGSI